MSNEHSDCFSTKDIDVLPALHEGGDLFREVLAIRERSMARLLSVTTEWTSDEEPPPNSIGLTFDGVNRAFVYPWADDFPSPEEIAPEIFGQQCMPLAPVGKPSTAYLAWAAAGLLVCASKVLSAMQSADCNSGPKIIVAAMRLARLEGLLHPREVDRSFTQLFDRRRGGKSTKALTDGQEELALKIYRELRRDNPKLSKTAACVRAAGKLLETEGISVSRNTLLRLLRTRE